MDFDFTEKERQLCAKVKDLFGEDGGGTLSTLESREPDEVKSVSLKWLQELASIGYLSPGLVDNGRNSPGLVLMQETLAAISPSLFLIVEVSARIFGRLVAKFGAQGQRESILGQVVAGKCLGAVALSEGGMNVEVNPFETKAVPSEKGFSITGFKGHVVNGPVADWIAVSATLDSKTALFMVKAQSHGLSTSQRFSTPGFEGTPICSVTLRDCFVPAESMIGPFEGQDVVKTIRMWEDQVLTSASLGLMRRCFDSAVKYAKEHKSGSKPIIAYQEVGFKLAEMLTLFQTAQLLAYRAAWMSETKDKEAAMLSHCAKVFCAEAAEKVASYGLQILGGQGYLRGNPVEEGYRNAKYLQIAGTSLEISRMKIGDGLLEGV